MDIGPNGYWTKWALDQMGIGPNGFRPIGFRRNGYWTYGFRRNGNKPNEYVSERFFFYWFVAYLLGCMSKCVLVTYDDFCGNGPHICTALVRILTHIHILYADEQRAVTRAYTLYNFLLNRTISYLCYREVFTSFLQFTRIVYLRRMHWWTRWVPELPWLRHAYQSGHSWG